MTQHHRLAQSQSPLSDYTTWLLSCRLDASMQTRAIPAGAPS